MQLYLFKPHNVMPVASLLFPPCDLPKSGIGGREGKLGHLTFILPCQADIFNNKHG